MSLPQTDEDWDSFWQQDKVDGFPPDLRLARAIKELFKDPKTEHCVVCGQLEYHKKEVAVGYDIRPVDKLGKVAMGYILYLNDLAHKNFAPVSMDQILALDLATHAIKSKPSNAVVLEGEINLYFRRSANIVDTLEQVFAAQKPKELTDHDMISYQ